MCYRTLLGLITLGSRSNKDVLFIKQKRQANVPRKINIGTKGEWNKESSLLFLCHDSDQCCALFDSKIIITSAFYLLLLQKHNICIDVENPSFRCDYIRYANRVTLCEDIIIVEGSSLSYLKRKRQMYLFLELHIFFYRRQTSPLTPSPRYGLASD